AKRILTKSLLFLSCGSVQHPRECARVMCARALQSCLPNDSGVRSAGALLSSDEHTILLRWRVAGGIRCLFLQLWDERAIDIRCVCAEVPRSRGRCRCCLFGAIFSAIAHLFDPLEVQLPFGWPPA